MALSFSHAVLAWARTKPADEAYDYCSNGNCAIAQFLRETGRAKMPLVAPEWWQDGPYGQQHRYDARVDDAADTQSDEPSTFGAFADRLEAAL